jgi:DNA uptake protein ComE-like DNA-binding protein
MYVVSRIARVALMAAFCAACALAGNALAQAPLELNAASAEQITALGVVSAEEAEQIVELRETLGSLQGYDDLKEIGLDQAKIDALKTRTSISYMETDCNC